jgi:hypothetical protein
LQSEIFYRIYWTSDVDPAVGQPGRTTDELIVRTGKGHASVSARVNELANAGWIVDSGKTRKTQAGLDAIVWVASPAAIAAVAEGTLP